MNDRSFFPCEFVLFLQIARNPQGQTYTSARVDVQETPGIDETSYVQPDAFKYIEKQPMTARSSSKPRRESDTSNLSQQKPAKILKTPMNTTVVEGGQAQFFCQVEGSPKPKVKRQKKRNFFSKNEIQSEILDRLA